MSSLSSAIPLCASISACKTHCVFHSFTMPRWETAWPLDWPTPIWFYLFICGRPLTWLTCSPQESQTVLTKELITYPSIHYNIYFALAVRGYFIPYHGTYRAGAGEAKSLAFSQYFHGGPPKGLPTPPTDSYAPFLETQIGNCASSFY